MSMYNTRTAHVATLPDERETVSHRTGRAGSNLRSNIGNKVNMKVMHDHANSTRGSSDMQILIVVQIPSMILVAI